MADAAIIIAMLPDATRFIVRAGDASATEIGRAFGVELPRDVCRSGGDGVRSALWLGPDEWLLIAPDGQGEVLAAAMTAALTLQPASIVEVSDRQVAISVSGPRAADVIAAFMPLDLHPSAFPLGMVTRTVFAKAEIVLWRTAEDAFRIEAWRSFAPYVMGSLAEASREYAA